MYEWRDDLLEMKIPGHFLAGGWLGLGLRLNTGIRDRELVATVQADDLDPFMDNKSNWSFSENLGTIYTYIQPAEPDEFAIIRSLRIPKSVVDVRIGITKWKPSKDLPLNRIIGGVYVRTTLSGIEVYEHLGDENE